MTDNMRIWDALSKTDPKHTKPFSRAGGFKGTATKPIWLTMRLTEHFGPAGTGWGMEKPEFQVVTASDEILVFCTVALWYRSNEATPLADPERAVVYGVGGDKVLTKRASGPFANDEAFKASYTDALSNAMKQIGVAADIHLGLFDDSKYREEVGREFAAENAPQPAPRPAAAPGPSSSNGRRMAADEPQLIDMNRQKGKLPTPINTPAAAGNAVKRIEWCRSAADFINGAKTKDELAVWWKENTDRLGVIETALPGEHEKLIVAFDTAMDRVAVRAA